LKDINADCYALEEGIDVQVTGWELAELGEEFGDEHVGVLSTNEWLFLTNL
jgi:hypothetical protein